MYQYPDKMSLAKWLEEYERRIAALERGSSSIPITRYVFTRTAIAASLTNTFIVADSVANIFGQRFPWPGSIVGIQVTLSAPITAGSLTLQPYIENTPTTMSLVMAAETDPVVNPSEATTTQSSIVDAFDANSLLRMAITTTSTLAPAGTANLLVGLLIKPRP
jgi:hypothetical protein